MEAITAPAFWPLEKATGRHRERERESG